MSKFVLFGPLWFEEKTQVTCHSRACITSVLFQFVSLASLMVLAWYMLKFLFPNDPKLRVMGLFGCTEKTVALGVPLINAIYAGNPAIGSYTLPLLIWYPMQLVIGSFLTPRLAKFVQQEQERLGIVTIPTFESTQHTSATITTTQHTSGGGDAQASESNGEPAEFDAEGSLSDVDATEKGLVSMKTLVVGTDDDDQVASLHLEAAEEGRRTDAS
jgi:hypothetical protein